VAAVPPGIGQTELEVLKVLWEHGPCTVREAKGYVSSDKRGLAHVFRAAVSRERMLKRRLKDLANQLCEGTATPLLLALVEGGRFTAAEIERFRQLLDELEGKKGKGRERG